MKGEISMHDADVMVIGAGHNKSKVLSKFFFNQTFD